MRIKLVFLIALLTMNLQAAELPPPVRVFTPPAGTIGFNVTKDGESLYVASWFKGVSHFNLKTGELIRTFEDVDPENPTLGYRPYNFRLSPDETLLLVGDEKTVDAELWDLPSGDVIRRFGPHLLYSTGPGYYATTCYAVGIASDRSFCVTYGTNSDTPFPSAIHVWDFASGEKRFSIQTQNDVDARSSELFALSADDRYLLYGRNVWDLQQEKRIHRLDPGEYGIGEVNTMPPDTNVFRISMAPDQRHVLLVEFSNPVTLWDYVSGELIRSFESSIGVMHVEASPDGRWLVGLSGITNEETQLLNHHYAIWDYSTGRKVAEATLPKRYYGGEMFRFHPNSRYIFGEAGSEVHMWDLEAVLAQASVENAEAYR